MPRIKDFRQIWPIAAGHAMRTFLDTPGHEAFELSRGDLQAEAAINQEVIHPKHISKQHTMNIH